MKKNKNMQKQKEEINIIDPDIQKTPQAPKDGVVGPIIGSIIIIALIVLGGLYYWGSIIENNTSDPVTKEEELLPELNESDEIEKIEEDLEATNTEEIDKLLNEIDSEIDDALNSL